jgi:hypothetical protein
MTIPLIIQWILLVNRITFPLTWLTAKYFLDLQESSATEPELWQNDNSGKVLSCCVDKYRNYKRGEVGWDGCYLNLLGRNQIPPAIIRYAFTHNDIQDDEALHRGLSIFRQNRTSPSVLVFASRIEGKDQIKGALTAGLPELKKRKVSFNLPHHTEPVKSKASDLVPETDEQNEEESRAEHSPKAGTVVTRAVSSQSMQCKVEAEAIAENALSQQYNAKKRGSSRKGKQDPLSQTIAHLIDVSQGVLEQLIQTLSSESSQEHCAAINRFSKNESFASDLKDLRLFQNRETEYCLFSKPKNPIKQTIVHSVSLLSPHWQFERSCHQFSKSIYIDMLNENVRSTFGCSHVITVADLSHGEIDKAYSEIGTITEKYEHYLIQKGKGIMLAMSLYNLNCQSKNSEFQVLQLPEIGKDFKPRQFGYRGTKEDFVTTSHAILILGMLSEMADPGCPVTDSDVPENFVIKLPISGNLTQRNAIIENILGRWMIPTCIDIPHCLNLLSVLCMNVFVFAGFRDEFPDASMTMEHL